MEFEEDVRSLWSLVPAARRQGILRLLLDYDGTLVPLAPAPELAPPDDELLDLLARLAIVPRVRVEIVSGRTRDTLGRWLGHLPITLWAEHGFWHRTAPADRWEPALREADGWTDRIMPILQQFTAGTRGSRIEVKDASVAWHYRLAQEQFGSRQADALRARLADLLGRGPLEILEGKKVIEVRRRGVSKAAAACPRAVGDGECTSIVFGDDRTDEDLFRAVPPSSITIAVGNRLAGAQYVVDDYRAVRRLLQSLTAGGTPEPGSRAIATGCRP